MNNLPLWWLNKGGDHSWTYLLNGNSDGGYRMRTIMAKVLSVCPLFFSLCELPPCGVDNEVTGRSNWMLILTSTLGSTALHLHQRMQRKLSSWQNIPPLFRVELSRLLGENKNLLWIQTSNPAIVAHVYINLYTGVLDFHVNIFTP